MLENLQKISRIIIQPVANLILRIHVKLLKEKDGRVENFHNEFTFQGKTYLKLDFQSFLTLELIDNTEWDKDKSIIINERNIIQIIKGFEKMLDSIYNGNIFAVNSKNEIVIYSDEAEKAVVRIYNLGNGNRMVLKPAKIYDENELSYEGVILYLNNNNNFVELPIDAFESLLYALKQTNIFVYSQALINYYISAIKAGELENTKPLIKAKPKKSVFEKASKEFVKSTGGIVKEADIMSDLEKKEWSTNDIVE